MRHQLFHLLLVQIFCVFSISAVGSEFELPDDVEGQKLFPDRDSRIQYWKENGGKLRVICSPKSSQFEIEAATTEKPIMVSAAKPIKFLEWSSLMIYSKKEVKGYHYRIGSRKKTLTCGELLFSVKAGSDSDNSGGLNGIFEYPLLEIYFGKTLVLPETLVNVHQYPFRRCDADIADCPISISGSLNKQGGGVVLMLKNVVLTGLKEERSTHVQTIQIP